MSHSLRTFGQAFLVIACVVAGPALASNRPEGLDQLGKPTLKSAGPLAFGPEGVLFVGDPRSATLFAIGVEPAGPASSSETVRFEGVNVQLASLVGVKPDDLLINDVAVQPDSTVVYLSASRGRGPDAEPVLAKISAAGKLTLLALDNVPYAKVDLNNAPDPDKVDRRGNKLRQESITDLQYIDGRVFVAGLSNEEFASKLRAISFPFTGADAGAGVEIYHGAHGQFETRAPVRTFVPFNVKGEPHLLAAYTCTPLVTFPVSELKAGAKLRGTTVAELGNHNRPLDIIAYEKDGRTFLLLANSARGVMKIATDDLDEQPSISQPVKGTAGLKYDTIEDLKGVEHLDKLGSGHALLLVRNDAKGLNIETISLP
ncbi:MAG TPA: hypothetical protein VHV55_07310 [Pirellulales bacterium]|jgi:hypothetical protein|nr:hypothetical protein [Pirellulales bacterium]